MAFQRAWKNKAGRGGKQGRKDRDSRTFDVVQSRDRQQDLTLASKCSSWTRCPLRGIPAGQLVLISEQSVLLLVALAGRRIECVPRGGSKYCRPSLETPSFEEALDQQVRVTSWSIKVLTLTWSSVSHRLEDNQVIQVDLFVPLPLTWLLLWKPRSGFYAPK